MKKARYTSVLVILILLASLITWPMGEAIIPQNQTISIIDTHDDRFITEAGVGIDAWLCHILDPTMDIVSYLVFRGLEINWWEPLTNATLRLRTTVNLDFDNESSVTVYGMKFSNLQDEGIINPSFVLSVPLTSAYVNVNTSQFYGQQWHEINVTDIVEELIRSHVWDGDGHAGVETGDSIGFVILGAEGYDTRWFIDYHYGTPSLASQLVIHWNHEPPPPSGYPDAIYNSTRGEYDIWEYDPSLGNWSDYDLNWVTLNVSSAYFVEDGAPDDIETVNDTHVKVTTMRYDSSNDLHNDTGAYDLNSAYYRFHINMTHIYDTGADFFCYPGHVWAMTSDHNDPWDETGEGVFLMVGIHYDTGAFKYFWMDMDAGVKNWAGSASGWMYHPQENWIEIRVNLTTNIMLANIYNASDFHPDHLEYSYPQDIVQCDENLRYGHITGGSDADTYAGEFSCDIWTYLDAPTGDTTWYVHETAVCTVTGPFDSYDNATDWIDTEKPDPEDPDPPGWPETGPFTRFRTRLYYLAIGFGCLFGPILFFAWRRPSGYYILCGAILMLMGIGMLLSIGQV